MVRCEPRGRTGNCSKQTGAGGNLAMEHLFIGKLLRRAGHRRRADQTATPVFVSCDSICANEVAMARRQGYGSSKSQVQSRETDPHHGPFQGKRMPPAPKYLLCSFLFVVVGL